MSKELEANLRSVLNSVNFKGKEKELLSSVIIRNLQIFDKDLIVDVETNNPSLQYKEKVKKVYFKIIGEMVTSKFNIKLNFHLAKKKEATKIKGESIQGVKNIIAVASGKGGVGKSTIAANLAIGLQQSGYKVGLVDADIYGPSMHIMLDLYGLKPRSTKSENKIKIKPLENYGVKVLSIACFVESQQAIVWRGPMASRALNQMLWDAEWGELDFLIIDLPPGTGDIHLSLVQSIPLSGAIIVSTPQDIALADAKKGINMFQMKSIDVPVLGLVENMSYFTPEELPNNKYFLFGKDGVKQLAEEMELNLLAEIPIIQSIRESGDAGRPAILQQNDMIKKSFIYLCNNVIKALKERIEMLPKTKKVDITHKKGCSEK